MGVEGDGKGDGEEGDGRAVRGLVVRGVEGDGKGDGGGG